ncbi:MULTISPECIES: PLP-dependent aminotransferase family protein [unclassified Chelatococcus]|uniref:aminotransferase-like domain-containing protein n=1 Tax=unclassified Chelatococcus TaxID=2638111 RepID=UPI00030ABA28|nr:MULTISPECIES: PLP-dependent aminotransferase family protein [unclassified Chelatococcus]ALA18973.1 GntR family transcriptional regulator [Chelatococcus sp. CO-6]
MKDWIPELARSGGPRYMAIADLIARDLKSGRLQPGGRLPPQRELAKRLKIDFTTVARGYVEAQKRGLIVSHVGRGTFVREPSGGTGQASLPRDAFERDTAADLSMNLPPEPDDPDLLARMREGLGAVSASLVPLLRYQAFGGDGRDKDAAAAWLARRGLTCPHERIFITPGAHPTLLALLAVLAKAGERILSEEITYPGVRSIAAQLGLDLAGLPMDDEGIIPEAFAEACERLHPKALYLNPTLQNPTTLTIPLRRREAICAVAQRYCVPIIEDDAYGFIPQQAPQAMAAIAPDLAWHIGGLSKAIGAGLRLAYVAVPASRAAWPFVSAMRAGNVMASPLTTALATRWIEDGTADGILAFIRSEATARQRIAAEILPPGAFRADPLSFNLWMPLPEGWSRSAFIGHMHATGIGVVASDAFTVAGPPQEFVRISLGGPVGRGRLREGLAFMAHSLAGPPEMSSTFF